MDRQDSGALGDLRFCFDLSTKPCVYCVRNIKFQTDKTKIRAKHIFRLVQHRLQNYIKIFNLKQNTFEYILRLTHNTFQIQIAEQILYLVMTRWYI